MAEYMKELTVPNSTGTGTSTYQIKEDPAIHYVTCGTAAATAAKTVTMSGFKLETGSWIAIKFTVTNTAAVADLTLNVNSTGAKGIKYRNANLPAVGTLTANRIYLFVYDGTYWQIVGDLDTNSNNYDRIMLSTRIYAGTAGVFNWSMVALDKDQRVQSFTTSAGTGTSKAFNTGAKFLYPATILYHRQDATVTEGNVVPNNILYEEYPAVDARYSCNITSSNGFELYKPVYIECTMDSNGYWSITSTGLTQTFTSGKYYILLGCTYNTSTYQIVLFTYNPMFYYDGTSLTGIFPQNNKTLTASTIDSTPGSFMFQGNNLIGGTYDWVGVQVSSGTDKLQIMGSDGHLITRMDDSNDSSGNWSDWIQTMSASDVSGQAGITVTPTTKDIGTGDDKYTVKDGVVIKHSNSITAQTSAVFKKITYDAQGHITGTANVVKGDIPALDYVPNTSTGVSAAINLLSVGNSTPTLDDYYVSQYADGGTTTTSYHRRPLSALWTLFKSLITVTTTGTGNAITAASIANDGNNRKITFTKGSTFSLSNHTHSEYVLKTGDTMSGDLKMSATSKGFWLKDKTGAQYPGVIDNGTNIWIGALQTASSHHTGQTYISAGYNGTDGGYSSAYISVPNADNTNASNYEILHFGNISSEVTGSGNAVTSVSFANGKVTATKGSTFLTQHPTITKSADTTSTASPSHGGTFTCIDSITRETNGHVTKINTKTVTLPAQYTHPTYTSKTSGLYKITVDGTGHVSATAAVAKGDIPALDYLPTTTKYALSDSVGGDALVAKKIKNNDLSATTLETETGSFAFRGAGDPFPDTDWVGLQIGDDRDKFQLITNGSDLAIRFNDTGGSDSTNWTDWSNIIDRRRVTATPSSKTHSNWDNTSERTNVVTKGWMSYWNGAFNSSGSSNLTYCNRGAFGTIVTKSTTDYSKVSLTASLTSGTKIGTITIDGTDTDLYCETNTNTDTNVTQSRTTSAKYRPVVLGGTETTTISDLTTTVTKQVYISEHLFVQPTTGDLTLYSASGDSPALRFRRGTLTDNLNDWLIKDSGGHLKFQCNTSSTDTYFDALTINGLTASITMKEDAVLRGKLAQYETTRQTSADLTTKGAAAMQLLLATSTMTSGKPAGDGYILNFDWDNTGKYQAQLYLPNAHATNRPPQYRVQNASADWSDVECKWRNFLTEDNYTDYTSRFGFVLDESSDYASYPWHKIATTTISNRYNDHEATFLVQKTWASYEKCVGILVIKMRSGTDYHFESGIFKWIFTGTGINPNDYVAVYTNGTNSYTVDIYVKITQQYDGWRFNILSEGKRHLTTPVWDMIVTGSQHGLATLPAGDGQIVSSRWDAYIPMTGSDDVTGNIRITTTSGDTGLFATRSDTSTSCFFGVGSGGANYGVYSNKISNWMFAANASEAFVYHTLANPSSDTTYAIPFGGNNTATGTKQCHVNNGLGYRTKEGTASTAGVSALLLGNATASGTAGNKGGRVRLYSTGTQYIDVVPGSTNTAYTATIPPVTSSFVMQTKGTTNWWGLIDGSASQTNWIRTTSQGMIPVSSGTIGDAHSSLGTETWAFASIYVRDIHSSYLELGKQYTVDDSAIGGRIKFHGSGNEIMNTVTLRPENQAGSANYDIYLPCINGTVSLIDTIATTSTEVPAASSVDNCTIDSNVKFLTVVLKVNGESSEHYTAQVPKIIGVHYFPITIGAGPSSGGGGCDVTSGFIQITNGTQSGTYKIIAGRKTQVATMGSSGWTISSPSWTPLIVAVYGIK